ncbi:hypothetical protein X798_07696 [Onchocerca flexuosa]|uniref:Uncharacterized protein n=1 Tax=Onchocerca flexuosa TaxID=387005 RepID=A0A238BJH6_9BILA|nr:hypothetical protein X798_07696 [Onchocerca flexuosa]
MSGEIFFDFGAKSLRKTQNRENQEIESNENREEDTNSPKGRGEKKKYRNAKLDEGVWKRTDYAKANAVDTMDFYGGKKQNETEHSAVRKKHRSSHKQRRKSRHRQRMREKEKKEKKHGKDEEELISLPNDDSDVGEEDEKERKKRKKKKKKRSDELAIDIDNDKKDSRYRSKTKKKQRPFRYKDSGNENIDDGGFESEEQANLTESSQSSISTDENTKTAQCVSMESMMPDNDMDSIKPPIKYETTYEGISKYIGNELFVELRYWAVLAVFICLLIIYRSFLLPIQCDTQFQ